MDDDLDSILWDCAFVSSGHDRKWILPTENDFDSYLHQQCNNENQLSRIIYSSYTKDMLNSSSSSSSSSSSLDNNQLFSEDEDYLYVDVLTESGDGVMTIIGGEVWEASLFLCSHIILHIDQYLPLVLDEEIIEIEDEILREDSIKKKISLLELGSGVGLPSFLLLNLALKYQKNQEKNNYMEKRKLNNNYHIEISASDYDNLLINNLIKHYQSTYTEELEDINDNKLKFNILKFDWREFLIKNNNKELLNNGKKLLLNNNFNLLYGSALCYVPHHSDCLASICYHYLTQEGEIEEDDDEEEMNKDKEEDKISTKNLLVNEESSLIKNNKKEIRIIQIKDRDGFQDFISLIKSYQLNCNESNISEEIITYSKYISLTKINRKEGIIYRYGFPINFNNLDQLKNKFIEENLVKTSPESFVLVEISC